MYEFKKIYFVEVCPQNVTEKVKYNKKLETYCEKMLKLLLQKIFWVFPQKQLSYQEINVFIYKKNLMTVNAILLSFINVNIILYSQ